MTQREKTDKRPSAQWSHSIHHKRASTRDEAKGDVYDPRVEGDDRIKAIVEQSIAFLAELSMMYLDADGVREEVVGLVHDFLCGATCLIEEANKVYGEAVLPYENEVRKAYDEYGRLRDGRVPESSGCPKNG